MLFTYDEAVKLKKGVAIALGSFDGLHIGHRQVLKNTLDYANENDLVPAVLLFDTHPRQLIDNQAPSILLTEEERLLMLKENGISVVRVSFEKIKDLPHGDFIALMKKELNVAAVCCGFNFHYGSKGAGNAQTLTADCEASGITAIIGEPVCCDGEPVSSTRIRQAIADGNIPLANKMLGRKFSYTLEVTEGDRRGRVLDAPTINQFFPEGFVKAKYGVYASEVEIDGRIYPGVTNIGVRPTIKTESLRSETHILGFSGDLYHKKIKVSLLRFTRGEVEFDSLESLKQQIARDKAQAEKIYNMNNKKIKAVFFDFDDTLQSRKGAYRIYCENFLTKYFPSISQSEREQKLDEMEEYVDGGYKEREVYFPELIELWKWDNHPPMQELYDSFNLDYGKNVVMLPHAVDTLKAIRERGLVLGAISNGVSELQNMKFDTAGIRDLFDVVVVSGDIGIYKPDRRIFDEAVRRAGVKNEEALFVGDHPVNDVQGALGADMQVIRMNYGDFFGKGLDTEGVLATIEHIEDVLNYI